MEVSRLETLDSIERSADLRSTVEHKNPLPPFCSVLVPIGGDSQPPLWKPHSPNADFLLANRYGDEGIA